MGVWPGTTVAPEPDPEPVLENGTEDTAERPDRDMGVSASGLGEWRSEEIRTVDEFWMVAIASDAVIVGGPLVFVGDVVDIAGEGESREMGGHGLVT